MKSENMKSTLKALEARIWIRKKLATLGATVIVLRTRHTDHRTTRIPRTRILSVHHTIILTDRLTITMALAMGMSPCPLQEILPV